jgi:hypothetical protein
MTCASVARMEGQALAYSLEVARDSIPVVTMTNRVPDRKWRYTDPAGHVHKFSGEDLPTLEWVVTGTYYCEDCRDTHDEGEWRCVECAAVVEPHYRELGETVTSVPGMTTYTLRLRDDGRSFDLTEEEMLRIRDKGDPAVIEIVEAHGG